MRAALGPAGDAGRRRGAPRRRGARRFRKRAATPGAAIADGADLLVIGRPIRDAADPVAAARAIAAGIGAALQARGAQAEGGAR